MVENVMFCLLYRKHTHTEEHSGAQCDFRHTPSKFHSSKNLFSSPYILTALVFFLPNHSEQFIC